MCIRDREHLQPYDLVDERGAAAADEQEDEKGVELPGHRRFTERSEELERRAMSL